jgi:hypothetical protein
LVFVEINSLADFRQLDFTFNVVRTLSQEPNTCEINVFNLKPETRSELETMKKSTVELEAGYDSGSSVIFKGDIRSIENNKESVDWITALSSGDGEKTIQEARVNKSFPAGTTVTTVLTEIAKTMKLANDGAGAQIGNVVSIAPQGALLGSGTQFLNGCVVSGSSAKEFSRICKSAGLEWSIQNGVIQLLTVDAPVPVPAVVLSPQTGLLGSPRVSSDGALYLRALMIPGLEPGRLLSVVTSALSVQAVAQRCTYSGDTAGNDWFIDIEAVIL